MRKVTSPGLQHPAVVPLCQQAQLSVQPGPATSVLIDTCGSAEYFDHTAVEQDLNGATTRHSIEERTADMQTWKLAAGIGLAVLVLAPTAAPARTILLEAETARLNPDRVEVVAQDTFPSKKGVSLKTGAATNVGSPQAAPDLVFQAAPPQAGRYWIHTHAATDARGAEAMRRAASKKASLRLLIAVGDGRPVSRVVFVPWSRPGSCTEALGKFEFTGRPEEIRVWLPEGVRLDYLQLAPYVPPKVPPAAAAYQPAVVPPQSRPRLWVNAESLPQVRANLEKGENAPLWARVQKLAARPLKITVRPDEELGYNSALESGAVAKAFVHLMTGDRRAAAARR